MTHISEELERQEKEATKALEEEADNYHEHPKHQNLQIDKVVHEEEETKSSKSDKEEDGSTRYIIQTFDADLEEELVWQLKDVREEIEKPPSEEEKKLSDKTEEDTELLTREGRNP